MNNFYSNQVDNLEDAVLDNYVALWRHASGDERLFVRSGKINVNFEPREALCRECRQNFIKKAPHHFFCGSYQGKKGCAYRRAKEGQKKYWFKWRNKT